MYDVASNAYSLPLMEKLIQTHIRAHIHAYTYVYMKAGH